MEQEIEVTEETSNLELLVEYTKEVNPDGVQAFADKRGIRDTSVEGLLDYISNNPECLEAFLIYHPDKEMLLEQEGLKPGMSKFDKIFNVSTKVLILALLVLLIFKIIKK